MAQIPQLDALLHDDRQVDGTAQGTPSETFSLHRAENRAWPSFHQNRKHVLHIRLSAVAA